MNRLKLLATLAGTLSFCHVRPLSYTRLAASGQAPGTAGVMQLNVRVRRELRRERRK